MAMAMDSLLRFVNFLAGKVARMCGSVFIKAIFIRHLFLRRSREKVTGKMQAFGRCGSHSYLVTSYPTPVSVQAVPAKRAHYFLYRPPKGFRLERALFARRRDEPARFISSASLPSQSQP